MNDAMRVAQRGGVVAVVEERVGEGLHALQGAVKLLLGAFQQQRGLHRGRRGAALF